MASRLFIFDDNRGHFGPLTDLRAVFEMRTGAVTTMRRIECVLAMNAAALHTPPRLACTTALRHELPQNTPLGAGDWLLVNARWLGIHHAEDVRALPCGHALLQHDGQLVAAHLPHDKAQHLIEAGFQPLPGIPSTRLPATPPDPFATGDGHGAHLTLITRPWHILDQLEATLAFDLLASEIPLADRAALPANVAVTGNHPFKLAADAKLAPMVVINVENGPVVIDSGAAVHSFAVITGPCYVGKNSTINAHADIRPNVAIGPSCKIGGEVSFSIVHGYTNKAHLGYLGHSLVGAWCNFGAATTVSNLKNTYGSIRVELGGESGSGSGSGSDTGAGKAEDTGRTFLGPVIGDFTLTAIGSRILTGSTLGTGTMLALSGFAPKHTDRFSFLTDDAAQRYDIEKFIDMARRMTTRRCCGLKQVEEDLLRALHAAPRSVDAPLPATM